MLLYVMEQQQQQQQQQQGHGSLLQQCPADISSQASHIDGSSSSTAARSNE
jgi:hypothetical protein